MQTGEKVSAIGSRSRTPGGHISMPVPENAMPQRAPVMDVWSSDGAHVRRAGIPCYGVSGIFFDWTT